MLNQYFGYLSGIIILISFIPYLRGILKDQTKPERMSWLIWSVLGGISFFSQLAKGASHSLWLTGAQTFGDLFIFLLSIKYGMGGLLKRDILALSIAGLSLIIWYLTDEPAIALFMVIFIDAIGAILTMVKSYKHPATEPITAWVLTALGGFFAILAVGKWNFILLSFPIYIFLINFMIVVIIILGIRRNHKML
ncbi:hypothetical protein HY227_01010 [Candidatus Wolfebacteria bacterium]|nr:hypothetical protein [Candidatus Wolfebacteria bacterium]